MAGGQLYGRGQVEWALARMAANKRGWQSARDPALLKLRIKRLLDADRLIELPRPAEAKAAPYAFNEEAPAGKGGEASFTGFDVYCLWLGLRLLHLGFKQSEVAGAMRLVRPPLRRAYAAILRRPAKDDYRAFLVLRGADLTELLRSGSVGHGRLAFAFPRPAMIFETVGKLFLFLGGEFLTDQEAIVLEIGGAALGLRGILAQAPEIKRGRPKLQ
ncbi:hypothetical protein GC173_14250 [bacterium]|nr:hypothetical protein [bacterium]